MGEAVAATEGIEDEQIEILELSTRAQKILERYGIRTVKNLMSYSRGMLLQKDRIGGAIADEIEEALAQLVLKLKD